jgi:abequosyltransferase
MIRLSICIATRNRSKFLLETVKCLLGQITDEVEIVIVDGASTDDSKAKIESLNISPKTLRYFYEDANSGVDGDFDKSIEYASGKYCWLFSDDDLLQPNTISSVINQLKAGPQLLVVNASIHTKHFEKVLSDGVLKFHKNRSFECQGEQAFLELAPYLSFIGAIVVERSFWLSRE